MTTNGGLLPNFYIISNYYAISNYYSYWMRHAKPFSDDGFG